MTLDAEIKWWSKRALKGESDLAAMVAFGVATGLKLAKRDYGAKDNEVKNAVSQDVRPAKG